MVILSHEMTLSYPIPTVKFAMITGKPVPLHHPSTARAASFSNVSMKTARARMVKKSLEIASATQRTTPVSRALSLVGGLPTFLRSIIAATFVCTTPVRILIRPPQQHQMMPRPWQRLWISPSLRWYSCRTKWKRFQRSLQACTMAVRLQLHRPGSTARRNIPRRINSIHS